MTALQKISLKQIKYSRGRFWTRVVGVVLSTAMILAVLLGSEAGIDAFRRFVIGQNGNWYWSADRLPAQAAATLSGGSGSDAWGIYGGKLAARTSQGTALSLYGVSGDFLQMMQTEFIDGKPPTTPTELVVEKQFATQYSLSVGDTIFLNSEDGKQHSMTISGIFSHSVLNLQLSVTDGGFNAFYGLDWGNLMGEDVYRFFSGTKKLDDNYYMYIKELDQSLSSLYPQTYSFWQSMLLTLSGGSGPDGRNPTLFFINLLRGVLLVIIAVASGSMIVNSFYISLAERRRTLGMLIGVGATGQQVTLCLLYEALCVGAVGIPLGLLVGCGGLGLVFQILSPLLKSMKQLIGADLSLHLTIKPSWILISIFISLMLLLFSALLPARSFSKGSIIQAISGGGEVKVNSSVTHTGKVAYWLFGAEGALAVKSAKRNRRRYRATVSSLAVCIALIIAAAGLAQYIPEVFNSNLQVEEYPIRVDYAQSKQLLSDDTSYQTLLNPQTPVNKITVTEKVLLDKVKIPVDRYTSKNIQLATSLNTYQEDNAYITDIEISSIPDKEFERIAGHQKESNGTIRCILANRYFYNTQNILQTHFQKGDSLQAYLEDMPVTLSIAVVDQREYVQHRSGNATRLQMITSQKNLDELLEQWQQIQGRPFPRSMSIAYQTEYPEDLKEELELVQYDNPKKEDSYNYLLISDNRISLALTQMMHLLLNVIFYGFSGLIALICACHVVTTISTGLTLQKREFAILQSLGMTEKGLRSMILMQSAVYSLEALVWGLPFGFALLWIEYSILRQLAGFLFTVPWWAIVVAVLGAFLLALLSAWPHLKELKKLSILQNIKMNL